MVLVWPVLAQEMPLVVLAVEMVSAEAQEIPLAVFLAFVLAEQQADSSV